MATYALGDLQGCCDALEALLQRIQFNADRDRLLLVGDLVNRGGQSLEVLQLLYERRSNIDAVLGNHDLSLLAYSERTGRPARPNPEFDAICEHAAADRLLTWLRSRPLAHYDAKRNFLLVHAGVAPGWSLQHTLDIAAEVAKAVKYKAPLRKYFGNSPSLWSDDLTGKERIRCAMNYLTRVRFVDELGRLVMKHHGPPGSQPAHLQPWFSHPGLTNWQTRIVFGHWSALGLYRNQRFAGLDTGYVWGGALTALRLDDERIFQVPGTRRS